jgi:hypothetical protein
MLGKRLHWGVGIFGSGPNAWVLSPASPQPLNNNAMLIAVSLIE